MDDYKKLHKKIINIGFGAIKSIKKNSVLIVEDLISMNKEEEKALRKAVNYEAHHKNCKIFCVTHTVFKTGIYSMLPLFHYIIYTSSPSNTPIIRACLAYFKIDKALVNQWLEEIKSKNGASYLNRLRSYFFFDCNRMTFCKSSNMLLAGSHSVIGSLNDTEGVSRTGLLGSVDSEPPEPAKSDSSQTAVLKMQQSFSEFFHGHPHSGQASAIFSIIVRRFGTRRINPVDLTISFKHRHRAESSQKKNLSVVDYVSALLSPTRPASVDHRVLHNFISSQCVIPTSCIKNLSFVEAD